MLIGVQHKNAVDIGYKLIDNNLRLLNMAGKSVKPQQIQVANHLCIKKEKEIANEEK